MANDCQTTANAILSCSGVGLYLKHLGAVCSGGYICTVNFVMWKNDDHPIMGAEEEDTWYAVSRNGIQ